MLKSPTGAGVEPRLQLLPGIGLVDLNHPELTERLAGIAAAQLEQFQARMRDGLLAASVAVGLGVLSEFLAAEVTEKAGPKGRHNPQRTASRHGAERATVPLGGRRVPIDKPDPGQQLQARLNTRPRGRLRHDGGPLPRCSTGISTSNLPHRADRGRGPPPSSSTDYRATS